MDPRISPVVQDSLHLAELDLPPYAELRLFSMFMEPTSREALALDGVSFLAGLSGEHVRVWGRPGWRSPQICAPDLYMSARDLQNGMGIQKADKSQRALTYEPQFGVNNQLMTLTYAIHWAAALNRKLRLPPILAPRASSFDPDTPTEQWLWAEDIFDFTQAVDVQLAKKVKGKRELIGKSVKVQPSLHSEWLHGHSSLDRGRIVQVGRQGVWDVEATTMSSAVWFPKQKAPRFDLRHAIKSTYDKKCSVETLRSHLGGCGDDVLAVDGMFYAMLEGTELGKSLRKMMPLNQQAKDVLKGLKGRLQQLLKSKSYVCMHVRQGDFATMCDDFSSNKYYTMLQDQGFKCVASAGEIVGFMREYSKPALVLSDDPAALDGALRDAPVATTTSAFVCDAVKAARPDLSPAQLEVWCLVMEQELCAAADHVRLNHFSTFSMRMAHLRDDKEVSFWKQAGT